jgi:NADH-quinone oxidoreductase subunit I
MAVTKMIKRAKNFAVGILSLIKGLTVTLKYCFKPAVTVQYPTQKLPMTERFRGLVGLRPEKCIVCLQCTKICPTACLAITSKQQEDKKKTLETFRYNMELCCFCGLCAQVCPTSAIIMTNVYEISVYDRKKLDINLLDAKKYDEWTAATIK